MPESDPSNPLYLKRYDRLVGGAREAQIVNSRAPIDPWSRPSAGKIEAEEVSHYDEEGRFLGYRKPSRSELKGAPAKMAKPGDVGGVIFLKPSFRPVSKRAQRRKEAEELARKQSGGEETSS
jgi:hypothetical protein